VTFLHDDYYGVLLTYAYSAMLSSSPDEELHLASVIADVYFGDGALNAIPCTAATLGLGIRI
jgi:hypothetical protein